jgi:hypothetical protein
MQMAFVSNGSRYLNRTIDVPQVLDTFNKQLAGPISKYNSEVDFAHPTASRLLESIVVFVGELAFEIDPEIVAFQPDGVIQQGLLGIAHGRAGLQIPLPDVLGAGERILGTDAGALQRFRHVRAERRECDVVAVAPGDQNAHALHINAGQRAARNCIRRAKPLPGQSVTPVLTICSPDEGSDIREKLPRISLRATVTGSARSDRIMRSLVETPRIEEDIAFRELRTILAQPEAIVIFPDQE